MNTVSVTRILLPKEFRGGPKPITSRLVKNNFESTLAIQRRRLRKQITGSGNLQYTHLPVLVQDELGSPHEEWITDIHEEMEQWLEDIKKGILVKEVI